MQFQSHYNRFRLSLEGTKNKYVSFCKNIISFCAPRTFRFADYTNLPSYCRPTFNQKLEEVVQSSCNGYMINCTKTKNEEEAVESSPSFFVISSYQFIY